MVLIYYYYYFIQLLYSNVKIVFIFITDCISTSYILVNYTLLLKNFLKIVYSDLELMFLDSNFRTVCLYNIREI